MLVLLDFPGLLFFSTYTLLVLFWAEIYHQVDLYCSLILPFTTMPLFGTSMKHDGLVSLPFYGSCLTCDYLFYDQARYLPADKLKLVYILVNAGIYLIQVLLLIFTRVLIMSDFFRN